MCGAAAGVGALFGETDGERTCTANSTVLHSHTQTSCYFQKLASQNATPQLTTHLLFSESTREMCLFSHSRELPTFVHARQPSEMLPHVKQQ